MEHESMDIPEINLERLKRADIGLLSQDLAGDCIVCDTEIIPAGVRSVTVRVNEAGQLVCPNCGQTFTAVGVRDPQEDAE